MQLLLHACSFPAEHQSRIPPVCCSLGQVTKRNSAMSSLAVNGSLQDAANPDPIPDAALAALMMSTPKIAL